MCHVWTCSISYRCKKSTYLEAEACAQYHRAWDLSKCDIPRRRVVVMLLFTAWVSMGDVG